MEILEHIIRLSILYLLIHLELYFFLLRFEDASYICNIFNMKFIKIYREILRIK